MAVAQKSLDTIHKAHFSGQECRFAASLPFTALISIGLLWPVFKPLQLGSCESTGSPSGLPGWS